jgi:hypothetical protein
MSDTDPSYLRRELLARLNAAPFLSWSPELLSGLIAVFDLAGIKPADKGNQSREDCGYASRTRLHPW